MANPRHTICTKEYKSFEITDFKANGDQGIFSATANAYGVLDSYREIVEPGMFAEDLETRGARRPTLWQHSTFDPIGYGMHDETPNSLRVEGHLNLKTQRGAECYELMKDGTIHQMSIGYDVHLDFWDEDGVRHLKKGKLYESSPVTFPANEMALVDAVKAYSYGPRDLHLVQLGLERIMHDKAGRMFSASNREAMQSVIDILQQLLDAQDESESGKARRVDDIQDTISEQELRRLADALGDIKAAVI